MPAGLAYRVDDRQRLALLEGMLGDASPELVFLPASDKDVELAYVGTPKAIIAAIGDSSCSEYVIAPPGLDWLICENHHQVMVAVGEPVASRFRTMEPRYWEIPAKPPSVSRLIREGIESAMNADWEDRARVLVYEDAPHAITFLVTGKANEREVAVRLLRMLGYEVTVESDRYELVEPRHRNPLTVPTYGR